MGEHQRSQRCEDLQRLITSGVSPNEESGAGIAGPFYCPAGSDPHHAATDRAAAVEAALAAGELNQAREQLTQWMRHWAGGLSACPQRSELRQPLLWSALATYVERSGDRDLIERLWLLLDRLPAPAPVAAAANPVPLMGVPILNRVDLLERLLASLDHPVQTLAIVNNSVGSRNHPAVTAELEALQQCGHPLIDRIRIARPFRNLGVAASWNLMLSSFPEAPSALLVNNDLCLAPGVLARAMALLDASKAQFLGLLPAPHAFSCFLLTSRCWDQLGLFDPGFHPAYCEDLDYRDRLQQAANVTQLDGSFAHAAMTACNPAHSATINASPELAAHNRVSYPLNQLWYLSERRLRRDPRGCWRRLWLAQWSDAP
jgi:GT2 family glycosyltransferase